MSTITPIQSTPSSHPWPSPDLHRFTVDDYERMAHVLDDARVELIDGYVVNKMRQKPPHFWTVDVTEEALRASLPQGWSLRREGPARIPEFDEPEPDLAVVRGSRENYRLRHPEPPDIALLIEVADASLDRDRGPRLSANAQGRIPVYWITNLVDRQVEVYTDPGDGTYDRRIDFKPGQDVPVVIDGALVGRIAVADILP
ncbi:MAG: Uma2 family endonuclease [Isosphaeraceae bacterium]